MIVVVEGKIKGKARVRFNSKTGIAFSTNDNVKYENWVKLCYQEQSGKYIEGPIRAMIMAYYEIPKSYSKKRIQGIKEGKEYPCKKPDSDNIAKIVLDSLNGIAYKDDAQIIELVVYKRYTEDVERVEFELLEI